MWVGGLWGEGVRAGSSAAVACRLRGLWFSTCGEIWEFPKIGVPYFGVGPYNKRILPFRVLYWGPLFSETPIQETRVLNLSLGLRASGLNLGSGCFSKMAQWFPSLPQLGLGV